MVMKRSVGEKIMDGVNVFLLFIIALTMLLPFYYIFAVSFASYTEYIQTDLLLWPKEWVTDAYDFILSSKEFVRSLWVSTYVTVIGTLVNLTLTATMAYALSRGIWGQKFFMFLVLFTFLFGAGLIPTYLVVKATGLLNTFWALIIPVAINPFFLIVMREFYYSIPGELHEAALIDGSNELQSFFRIILPLSKPALATFGLFYAVYYWNIYFSAILYLTDPTKWTVQVILRQIVILDDATNALASASRDAGMSGFAPPPETVGMAAILLATIPILIVYPFLQKHFAKGVMLGSVKG